MPSDNVTFFLGFAAVFAALGWYLWHLEQQVKALARRVHDAEQAVGRSAAATQRPGRDEDRAATAKNPDGEAGP